MAKDYRRRYEQYLGFRLPKEMHVHHLDHNRENDKISNLVAIPGLLHGNYHGAHKNYTDSLESYGRIKKPTAEEAFVFDFSMLSSGKWREHFNGTLEEFLVHCQRVSSRQNILALIKSEQRKYLTYAIEIRKHKQEQSKHA